MVRDLLAEPAAIADLPWYAGAISTVGCLAWFGSGMVACFAASLCQGRSRYLLLGIGLLSLWLSLDDALMLHEHGLSTALFGYADNQDNAGFQRGVYLSYVLLTGAWLFVFRRELARRESILLLLALIWFALSVGIDVLEEADSMPAFTRLARDAKYREIVEDGCKLLGIVTWSLFCCWLARAQVVEQAGSLNSPLAGGVVLKELSKERSLLVLDPGGDGMINAGHAVDDVQGGEEP
jgi:hypothetical protein